MAAREGSRESEAEAILNDRKRSNFSAGVDGLRWRERDFSCQAIQEMREKFAISFGSCSFEEPIEEMRELGWLE
jgi:hypothetical protein